MIGRPTELAVIRPARYGIRDGRGYLLYWERETSTYQAVDSWQTYATPAAARAAAAEKNPNARIREEL